MILQHALASYEGYVRRKRIIIVVQILFVPVLILVSISFGPVMVPFGSLVKVLSSIGSPSRDHSILLNIRLPQALTACVVGGGLSLSGAVMQTILQNPLGSPYTLGISHAAAFGAAASILIFSGGIMQDMTAELFCSFALYRTTLFSFAGAAIVSLVLIRISRLKSASSQMLVLIGVAIGALCTAGTMFLQYFADDIQLASMVFWTFGDTSRASWSELALLSSVTVTGSIFIFLQCWKYNATALGSESAQSLGISVNRLRTITMMLSSLITSVVISFIGVIGFVGLAAPHIARRLVGEDHRYFLISSLLAGSILLMLSDLVARMVIAPRVLPVAIITAFIGAPLFIYLLIKGYRS